MSRYRTYSRIEVNILEPVNSLLAASWAPLSALHLPDVADLPPLDEDHESEDTIDIVLRAPGALGVELQERVKEGASSLVIAGLEPQGQAKPAVAQLGLSIDDVKDAVLVAVDGAQCAGRDRDDIVRRVTHERPTRGPYGSGCEAKRLSEDALLQELA